MEAGIRFRSDFYVAISVDDESGDIAVVCEKIVEGEKQTLTGKVVWDD